MNFNNLITLMICAFVFSSCSGKKKTQTNISVKAGFIGSSVFTGGVMVWGQGPSAQDAGIALEDENASKDIELVPGEWTFQAIGWDGASPLLGTMKCGQTSATIQGVEATVSIAMSAAQCNNSLYSPGAFLSGNEFLPLKFIVCDDVSLVGAQGADCNTTKGTGASFRVSFNEYDSNGKLNGKLSSACINETSSSSSMTSTALKIPVGGNPPLNLTIEAFAGTNCTGTQTKFNFPTGLVNFGSDIALFSSGTETEVFLNSPLIPPLLAAYTSSPAVYNQNTTITLNSPTNNGGVAASYSIAPALPTGLTLNTITGEISGTPTIDSVATNYTITATNIAGFSDYTLNLTVLPPAPTITAYTDANAVYIVGQTITNNTPTLSGGTATSFSIAPALPSGLTLNTGSGEITGTPSIAATNTSYTITALNAGGSGTQNINIEVVNPATLTFDLAPTHDFGQKAVGSTWNISVNVTNATNSATATSMSETFTGDAVFAFAGVGTFPGTGGDCSTTLAAGATCSVVLEFSPVGIASYSSIFDINYHNGINFVSASLNLQGSGAAPALITISETDPYDYGVVPIGATASHTFTLTNVGTITATGMGGAGLAAPFNFTGGSSYPGTTGDCGATLASAASCTVEIDISPFSAGVISDTLEISYNDGVSVQMATRSIQGTGVNPASLSLSDGPNFSFSSVFAVPVVPSNTLGSWDANTNSPALADGTGNSGDYYLVSTAGSQNLGAAAQNFAVSDLVVYDGTKWHRTPAPTTHAFTLTNSGNYMASSISEISLAPPFYFTGGVFPGTGGDCTSTLAAAATCQLEIVAVPTQILDYAGTLEISYNNGATIQTTSNTLSVLGGHIISASHDGGGANCVVFNNGQVKCWGSNASGKLGLEHALDIGDGAGEMGPSLPFVNLGTGAKAKYITGGNSYFCALMRDHRVKCWGNNTFGQLGLGDTATRGAAPSSMGDSLPYVDLGVGRTAKKIAAGGYTTCAILDNDQLKCWGRNNMGQAGQGNLAVYGATMGTIPANITAVDLGASYAVDLAISTKQTCAILNDATMKCWGQGTGGVLGNEAVANIGDGPGEMGVSLPAINLGTGRNAISARAGFVETCALLDNSLVKCWGINTFGQLGLGDTATRGHAVSTMGDNLGFVDLGTGRTAVELSASSNSEICARLDNASVKCWGKGIYGGLGSEATANLGDAPAEMGDALMEVDLGTTTLPLTGLFPNAPCAIFNKGEVKCWGLNSAGQLGLGDTVDRGTSPAHMGDNLPFIPLR